MKCTDIISLNLKPNKNFTQEHEQLRVVSLQPFLIEPHAAEQAVHPRHPECGGPVHRPQVRQQHRGAG